MDYKIKYFNTQFQMSKFLQTHTLYWISDSLPTVYRLSAEFPLNAGQKYMHDDEWFNHSSTQSFCDLVITVYC